MKIFNIILIKGNRRKYLTVRDESKDWAYANTLNRFPSWEMRSIYEVPDWEVIVKMRAIAQAALAGRLGEK